MGASVGRAALVIALGVCVYGIGAALYGARTGRREWVDSGRRSVYALAVIMTVCFAILEVAFIRSDFSFDTVAGHSSTTTPNFYKASAIWSSQEGSLLLWAWLLSLWSSAAIFFTRKRLRDVVPYATAVLLGFAGFFTGLLVFLATPFATTHPTPLEGVGLNPLLRHPSMMIHPPMLYSGYTLSTIPFAFAVGALIVRRVDAEWIRAIRRFALAAWFFLGIGVLLGARWSYAELGWGGYWAWDPVENAALMPWLIGTALIHSIMIQEKRGMLKVWNASLALATGTLAILGTFLVRSGILQSIHAFGASTLGTPFVILIGALVAGAVYLIVTRRDVLRSDHHLDSLLSRESIFLLNNLVLVGVCFAIFWGTFFPLISEAVTGTKASVGPPFFAEITVPFALVLVLLSGIGPVIAWRRATPANARRNFRVPILAAILALVVLLAATDAGHKPLALAMFCCAAFVFGSIGQEFYRGIGARRAMSGEPPALAAISLVRRNRRRYGGYIVHLGMALLFVGVAASSAFQATRDAQLSPGQSVTVGGYKYDYVRATASVDADPKNTGSLLDLGAVVNVSKGGRHIVTLSPSKGYYPAPDTSQGPVGSLIGSGEPTSHVALKAGVRRDIWSAIEPNIGALQPLIDKGNAVVPAAHPEVAFIVLAAIAQHYRNNPPPATFRLIVSPLVTWIWLGGLVVLLGALIAMWPGPGRPVRARYLARVGRELKQAKQAHVPA